MRNFSLLAFVSVLLVAVLAVSLAAVAVEPDRGSPPADQPRFKAGDIATVAVDNARLMTGNEVVAAVPKGQRIVVIEVRGSWIGTYLSLAGQQKSGWIGTDAFVPAAPSPREPVLHTVAMPVEAQPAQSTPSYYSGPERGRAADDYHVGYYLRHETDPNIHTWEPWRYQR
jgi:hypothetical protein